MLLGYFWFDIFMLQQVMQVQKCKGFDKFL